jgi:predicted nucleic acid-binding protein
MAWLIDTGVLLRLVNRSDPSHADIRRALRELRARGESLVVTAQNLVKFWNVCTRPESTRGGYGLPVELAERKLRLLERVFALLPDAPAVNPEWRRLVVGNGIVGVQVHDARLVAMMKTNGVANILTLNARDFGRYDGIHATSPSTVIERPTA